MKFFLISGIFLFLGSLNEADPSCKSLPCITLDMYYSSLCPGSMRFISRKLAQSYPVFKDYLHLNFIPYGKSNRTRDETGQWVFTCQHGENECRSNKAQACALNVIEKTIPLENEQEYSFNLMNCTMSGKSSNHSVSTCAERIGLNQSAQASINRCVESSEGDDLLAANGDKTDRLRSPLLWVPTFMINGNYSAERQHRTFFRFRHLICDLLKEEGKNLTECA